MKKLMLLIGVLLFVSQLKAQSLETSGSANDNQYDGGKYYEIPEIWLDGDSIRASFTVHFPDSGITFDNQGQYATVQVGFGAPVIDVHWTNATIPRNTTITYYGAKYVGDLMWPSPNDPSYSWDLSYHLELSYDGGILGGEGYYGFTYYPE